MTAAIARVKTITVTLRDIFAITIRPDYYFLLNLDQSNLETLPPYFKGYVVKLTL